MTPLPPPVKRWWHSLDRLQHTIVKLVAFGAVMTVVVISLVIAVAALSTADDARGFSQADCQTWRDLSTNVPSPTATQSGLQLYADFRIAYARKGCEHVLGALPAADPRVAKLLPPGVH